MNENQNSQFLGKEKISKLMLKFSIPCVLSLLVSILLMAIFFVIEGILCAAPAADLIAMIAAAILTVTFMRTLKADKIITY